MLTLLVWHPVTTKVEAEVGLELTLEHLPESPLSFTFRVAFHSATKRCLLPYPCVTGLKFYDESGRLAADWTTRLLVSQPLDRFVLNPDDRISFDLLANINNSASNNRWGIQLPAGAYQVNFLYIVDRDADSYGFMANQSRFAAITPLWCGTLQSNPIQFNVEFDAETLAV